MSGDQEPTAESYEIFLSYHWTDAQLAQQLYDGLIAAGFRVWFDRKCIAPGEPWMPAIERGITQVHTFVVLLTDSAPRRWVEAEVGAAIRRAVDEPESFRIIPIVAAQGGVGATSFGAFLDAFNRYTLAAQAEGIPPDELQRLIDALKSAGPANKLKVVDEPYRGLEVFRTDDQCIFFGRWRETCELVERLARNRWVQVEGASGSGKSSLVRAGLMPALTRRLRDRGDTDWTFLTMRPGRDPVKELAAALLDLDEEPQPLGELDRLESLLWQSPRALTNLLREWNQRHHPDRPRPVLLVVDQLEELFSPATTAARSGLSDAGQTSAAQFVDLVCEALDDADGPLRLVTTIRSDFLHRFTRQERLAAALNRAERFVLGQHSREGLRQIIVEPLRLAGCRVESEELVERLVTDTYTEEGGRLPLLSHALRSLWQAARKRGDHTPTLRLSDYEAIGGVGGAVTQSADKLLQSLTPQQRDAARRMLLELVDVGRGSRDVRKTASRRALLAAGGPHAETVLDCLSGGAAEQPLSPPPPRLLVVHEAASRAGQRDDRFAVDLIHDALVDRWETFRGWLNEARRDLERRDDLEAAAAAWKNAGAKLADVPAAGILAYYTAWEAEPLPLSDTAGQFLAATEKRAQQRRRQVVAAFAALAAAVIAFAGLGLWAMTEARRADENAALAQQQSDLAMDTLDQVIRDAESQLADIPAAYEARRHILYGALQRLSKISPKLAKADRVQRSVALVHLQLGDVARRIGAPETAADILRRAVGDAPVRRGGTREALTHYETARDIMEKLRGQSPGNPDILRTLAVCYLRIGDVQQDLGETAKSIAAYQQSKQTIEQILPLLHEPLPPGLFDFDDSERMSKDSVQNLLCVVYDRLGDASKPDQAAKYYQQSLDIAKKIQGSRSRVNQWVAYNKLGQLLLAANESDKAWTNHQQAYEIVKELASETRDVNTQRRLYVSTYLLGDVKLHLDETDAALKYYQDALGIAKQIADENDKDFRAQRDVSDAYEMVGLAQEQAGDHRAAIASFEKAVGLSKSMSEIDLRNVLLKEDLRVLYDRLAKTWRTVGDLKQVLHYEELNCRVLKALVELDPGNSDRQRTLSFYYRKATSAAIEAGEAMRAAELALLTMRNVVQWAKQHSSDKAHAVKTGLKTVDELESLQPKTAESLFTAARAYGVAALAFSPDEEERMEFAQKALALLREAIDAGLKDRDRLQSEPDLAAVRQLPAFADLPEKQIQRDSPKKPRPGN